MIFPLIFSQILSRYPSFLRSTNSFVGFYTTSITIVLASDVNIKNSMFLLITGSSVLQSSQELNISITYSTFFNCSSTDSIIKLHATKNLCFRYCCVCDCSSLKSNFIEKSGIDGYTDTLFLNNFYHSSRGYIGTDLILLIHGYMHISNINISKCSTNGVTCFNLDNFQDSSFLNYVTITHSMSSSIFMEFDSKIIIDSMNFCHCSSSGSSESIAHFIFTAESLIRNCVFQNISGSIKLIKANSLQVIQCYSDLLESSIGVSGFTASTTIETLDIMHYDHWLCAVDNTYYPRPTPFQTLPTPCGYTKFNPRKNLFIKVVSLPFLVCYNN